MQIPGTLPTRVARGGPAREPGRGDWLHEHLARGWRRNYFGETDFELIKLFAGQASIALRNADTHRAVTQRADTDALTGLGNHGSFQRDLGDLARDFVAERGSAAESRPSSFRSRS